MLKSFENDKGIIDFSDPVESGGDVSLVYIDVDGERDDVMGTPCEVGWVDTGTDESDDTV